MLAIYCGLCVFVCRVLSGRGQDLVSSGLGSPEVLPSVLEQATVDVSSLQEADDNFLLQPTPQGLKSYCIIQRTRSVVLSFLLYTIRTPLERPLVQRMYRTVLARAASSLKTAPTLRSPCRSTPAPYCWPRGTHLRTPPRCGVVAGPRENSHRLFRVSISNGSDQNAPLFAIHPSTNPAHMQFVVEPLQPIPRNRTRVSFVCSLVRRQPLPPPRSATFATS